MNKFHTNISVLFTTRTLRPAGYFQLVFLLHSLATLTNKISIKIATNIRSYIYNNFDREVIINNRIATFSVNAKNDSFVKSIPTYELTYQGWLDRPKKKDIMIDIGSNIGFFSLLALNKLNYKKVYAFEPHPDSFSRLSMNVHLNNLEKNMEVFNFPLSATEEVMDFKAGKVHTGGSSLAKNRKEEVADVLKMSTKTFDAVSEHIHIDVERISFVKIDVEGHENEVLLGMKNTLQATLPGTHIFIELNSSSIEKRKTVNFLHNCGFTKSIEDGDLSNYLFVKMTADLA